MSKRPTGGSDAYTQMLMQQNAARQKALVSEQATFSQQAEQERQNAAARVAGQQALAEDAIKKKASTPMKLGTLLTSPTGLLGNPVLSGTKLS